MGLFWEIMYVVVTVLCTAVLPFAIFYYEVRGCWWRWGCGSLDGRHVDVLTRPHGTGRRRPDGKQGPGGVRRHQVHARLPVCLGNDHRPLLLLRTWPPSPLACLPACLSCRSLHHTRPPFIQIGRIRLPVSDYPVALTDLTFHLPGSFLNATLTPAEVANAGAITRMRNRHWMTFQSSFIVYMIALVSFVGWFLFAVRDSRWRGRGGQRLHLTTDPNNPPLSPITQIFGGVGLAALPMDLITGFTARPKPMTAEQLAHEQLILQARVADLIEVRRSVCVRWWKPRPGACH